MKHLIYSALIFVLIFSACLQCTANEYPLGMMFFVPYTPQLVQREHFDWMRSYGFNSAEPEFMWMENGMSRWGQIESQDGKYNWFGLDHYVDDARKAGVKVFLDPSNFGFGGCPYWMWRKYPDFMVMTPYGATDELVPSPMTPSIAHPGYIQEAREFYAAMAARYKDDPNVAGIIIGNERGMSNSNSHNLETYYGIDYCEAVKNGFHQYLQQKYGTVSQMNSIWGKSYTDFSQVNWKGAWITQASSYRGEWLDYNLYRYRYYADFHRQINAAIKAVAPNMPTMAASLTNSMNVRTAHGGEPSEFDFVDIIADKHYQGEDDRTTVQMLAQFCSDITGRPYFAINMGNLNQMYDYPMTDNTTTQMVRSTWELIGAGGCGLLYWIWVEPYSEQLAFHTMLVKDAEGKLVVRNMVNDLSLGAKVVRRYDKLFLGATAEQDTQIAVLDPGLTYIQLAPSLMKTDVTTQSFPNQAPQWDLQWKTLVAALQRENYRPNHVSDTQIRAGCLSKHKVMVLGGADYLYQDVASRIEKWMADSTGHYLILTQNSGKYDELGRTTTWRSRMVSTYGSRVLSLNIVDDYWLTSTLSSFLATKVQRTFDIEGGARPDVEANLLRYQDKATGKKAAMFVLINRKSIASGGNVSNFIVRLTDSTPYQVAYSIDPRSAGVPQPLTISRSGNDSRVSINLLKDVQIVILSKDPQLLNNADTGHTVAHDKLSEKARWWDKSWPYRVPVQFYSAEMSGQDMILRYRPTHTSVLALNPQRARVFEYDQNWLLGSECPSLVRTNVSGQLEILWKMPGNTPTFKQRNFYVYLGGSSGGNDLAVPADDTIKLESENTASQSSAFYVRSQYDASCGRALSVDRPDQDPAGYTAQYSFTVAQTGTYSIHIRHIGFFNYGGDVFPLEQFTVKIDGNQVYSQAMPFDRLWQILSIPNQSLSSGQHSLEVFVKKGETDFTMDTIIIAPPSYDPFVPAIVDYTWQGSVEQPQLMTDNFNSSRFSGDINLENSAGVRQSGRASPVNWVERPQTVSGGSNDTLTVVSHPSSSKTLGLYCTGQSWGSDVTKYVWVSPNHSFTESGNLEVELDVDPYGPGSQSGTNWAGLIFGTTLSGTYVIPTLGNYSTASSPGVGMTLDTNGNWSIYNDSTLAASGVVSSHTGFYHVKVDIASGAFDGTPATLTFYIDSNQIYAYTRSAGFTGNFITLAGLGLGTTGYQTHFFDNFKVTVVEEQDGTPPTSFATPPGGLFHWNQEVVLGTNEPATVFYSTDGSEPTTQSAMYTKPLFINEPTTLKFFAVDASGNAESPKKQATYTTDPVLFTDNFTPRHQTQYDINEGYNLPGYDGSTRQAGGLSPMTWTERAETVSGAPYDGATMIWHPWGDCEMELMCTAQGWGGDPTKYAWVSPDHNFTESGELIIDVDVDPYAANSQPGYTNLAAIIIGTNGPGTYAVPMLGSYTTAASPGVSFVLNGDTPTWTIYDNSSAIASGNIPSPHAGFYHVRITIDTSCYTSANTVDLGFYIDGSLVYSYTRQTGFSNNYITLAGLSLHPSAYQLQFFDNFAVATNIAEIAPISTAEAKSLSDGSPVALQGSILYLNRGNFGYIEERDRFCGIRIEGTISTPEGDVVSVIGVKRTSPSGEAYIEIDSISSSGTYNLKPLGSNNKSAYGELADGLFITTWGQVKVGSVTADSFVITDGSDDIGIRVLTVGTPNVTEGQFVIVSGAAGLDGGRVIYKK